MTQDPRLEQSLLAITRRYRKRYLGEGLAVVWLAVAAAAVVALVVARGGGAPWVLAAWVGLAAVVGIALIATFALVRRSRDPLWIARRVEAEFPDLDARLLAALEQHPEADANEKAERRVKRLSYLQRAVIDETLEHNDKHHWGERLVPTGRLRFAGLAYAVALGSAVFAIVAMFIALPKSGFSPTGIASSTRPAGEVGFTISVEPKDTSLERGTGLVIFARFGANVPPGAELLTKPADGQTKSQSMSRSLDDPVFAARVPSVDADLKYAIRYAGQQTEWFSATVFDHPELKQADAKLTFPAYTGEPEKIVEDTRRVTAVEGTKAALTFRLNKPVTSASLSPAAPRGARSANVVPSPDAMLPAAPPSTQPAEAIVLTIDPADPTRYTLSLDLTKSAVYRLELRDEAGRGSKRPAELSVTVLPNRAPDLKLEFPAKDVDVSPIEELTVRGQVWDDFGVSRVGISYSLAGQEAKDVVLAENVSGRDRKSVDHTIALEELNAEPDQLLSYFMWVEDIGPDGAVRRTSGDMFFAEVRPFEEVFRQGEQPSEEEQRQQQQQQQQGGQNARQAEEQAETQKQIIAATWKLIRRETTPARPTDAFVSDAKLIAESQQAAREKAEAMAENLTDEKSKAHLKNVLKFMEQAAKELTEAAEGPAVQKLSSAALPAEQAAYQELLRLRAREHEVVRGNQRQQRGQQSQSSASSRRQRQLDQLRMQQEQNRYEQQRAAAEQQSPQQEQQQRETRQVLNRLRELAQRQEDLNQRMKEMESALAEAQDEKKQEELKRQLARLREQQQEMLRDNDELRDRMQSPENQERMAEARQQLEQGREEARQAAEALERGQVQQAQASGARASERLNELREQFRRDAAGQFGEQVERLRQDARDLDERQQELSRQLNELNPDGTPRRQSPQAQRGNPNERGNPAERANPADQPNAGEREDPANAGRPNAGQPNAGQANAGRANAGEPGEPGAEPAARQPNPRPSLRDGAQPGREQIARDLADQKEKLERLLEDMRRTVEESESPQPLLSRQLYDAVRQSRQERTDEAIDATRRMVDRGFVEEAQRAGGEATRGTAQLRQSVEQAARGVLGDETEALRRARAELDALNQQVEREMGASGRQQADAGSARDAATRPAGEQVARNDRQGNRPGENENAGERQAGGANDPASRPAVARNANAGERQPGERQPGEGQQGERQPGDGQPGEQANAGQPGGQQPGGERQGNRPGQGNEPGQDQANAGQQRQPGGQNPSGQNQPGQQQAGRGQPGERQLGQGSPSADGMPSEQGQEGSAQGRQPGNQPGGNQPGGNQPGRGQQANAGQPGENGRPNENGQPNPNGQPNENGQPGENAQANAGQPGGNRQGGNQPGQRRQPGLRQGNEPPGERNAGEQDARGGELGGPSPVGEESRQAGPFTGGNFREFSDRLRDVEEMVGDPRLRAEAARIRERARAIKAEMDRHSKEPNWDMVRSTIGQPLAELRQAVNQELRRREGNESMVPIDRDPVPPEYADQVKKYYERLGGGK